MPPKKPLTDEMVAVLVYLWDEATLGCGWLRRGVRGWRMYAEIRAATGEYLMETLPYLAKRGLLDRVDVREPGRERAAQLYRISAEGARVVRALEIGRSRRLPRPAPEDENEGTFYVPGSAWSALRTPRMYAAERAGPVRLGEPGWMTQAEVRGTDRRVRGDDFKWLVVRDLVERREVPDPDRPERRLVLYRATMPGRCIEPVEAVRSPGEIEYVAVRARGSGSGAGG